MISASFEKIVRNIPQIRQFWSWSHVQDDKQFFWCWVLQKHDAWVHRSEWDTMKTEKEKGFCLAGTSLQEWEISPRWGNERKERGQGSFCTLHSWASKLALPVPHRCNRWHEERYTIKSLMISLYYIAMSVVFLNFSNDMSESWLGFSSHWHAHRSRGITRRVLMGL